MDPAHISAYVFKIKHIIFWMLWSRFFYSIMKTNKFRGELSNTSAYDEPLAHTSTSSLFPHRGGSKLYDQHIIKQKHYSALIQGGMLNTIVDRLIPDCAQKLGASNATFGCSIGHHLANPHVYEVCKECWYVEVIWYTPRTTSGARLASDSFPELLLNHLLVSA